MKSPVRNFFINLLALYGTAQINNGFAITGGAFVYFYSALLLTVINTFVKPLLKIMFLPINMITLGFFSWVINLVTLYILKLIVPQITFTTWHFMGLTSPYLSLPPFTLSPVVNFIAISFLLSFIAKLLHWVTK